MLFSLSLSTEAEQDIFQAYEWYEQQRPGLGDEFIAAIEFSFSSISSTPDSFGFRKKNVRGCLVKRFPYIVLFFIEGTRVCVVSVFHTHRKPTP